MDDKIRCSPDAQRKQGTKHNYAANQSSVEQYHCRLLHTKSVLNCAYQADTPGPNAVNKYVIQRTFTPLASAPYRTSSSHIQVCSVHASNTTSDCLQNCTEGDSECAGFLQDLTRSADCFPRETLIFLPEPSAQPAGIECLLKEDS